MHRVLFFTVLYTYVATATETLYAFSLVLDKHLCFDGTRHPGSCLENASWRA